MPDITINTISPTTTADADPVMENFYKPGVSPSSFEVTNGWLDDANRQAGWDIQTEHVRPNALARGGMVGNTSNVDYFPEIFPFDNADAGAYTAIPGASINFYLPVTPSVVIFTWQLVSANSSLYTLAPVGVTEFRFRLDGSALGSQFRVNPATATSTVRDKKRDRIWSGHASDTTLTKGWHEARLEVFHQRDPSTLRLRVRNMKYIWFK